MIFYQVSSEENCIGKPLAHFISKYNDNAEFAWSYLETNLFQLVDFPFSFGNKISVFKNVKFSSIITLEDTEVDDEENQNHVSYGKWLLG